MSRRTDALARAFVAGFLRGWLPRLLLAGLVALVGLSAPAPAADKDYATCSSNGKVGADQLIAACTRAIALTPGDAKLYVNRAKAFGRKGEHDRAIVDCDKAIEIEPANERAYGVHGIAWQDKGDNTRAIASFDEAIRLDPANSAFYFNRAKSWGLKKDYARALADLDEVVRLDPANAQAYRVRGMTMARIGNSKKAFADLDKAISLKPTDPKSYFIRALFWEASDLDKAIADLDQAIALDPTNADYRKERLSVQLDKRRTGSKAAQQAPDPANSPPHDAARAPEAPAAPQPAKPAESPAYEPLQLYPKKETFRARCLESETRVGATGPGGCRRRNRYLQLCDPTRPLQRRSLSQPGACRGIAGRLHRRRR